jgi:hypothetical protein
MLNVYVSVLLLGVDNENAVKTIRNVRLFVLFLGGFSQCRGPPTNLGAAGTPREPPDEAEAEMHKKKTGSNHGVNTAFLKSASFSSPLLKLRE